ncbi:MAG: triose-phosphate isomerase [Desulfobulbaceae bacterium]|nr:triose-phosphate isomerase [Desulfobulbaceae bacterium]HIJ79437.1 triose-phosphate isomerase [Deltaproteobacteria bacterium]
MQRKPLIAGNWKMYTTAAEARELAAAVAEASKGLSDREVMIAPPYTALPVVKEVVAGSNLKLAAQNICWEEKGAFTGEISPLMLLELGCSMAIIGHSERRHIFGETDALINKRVAGAIKFGLVPVLCIGETLDEREGGRTMQVLEQQVRAGLADIVVTDPAKIVVAYEPVWAIGTGKTASEQQAQEAHHFVRDLLAKIYQKSIASQIRILYGGSVNPGNVDVLMSQEDVDGALVGGAALSAESFTRIINFK